MMLIGGGCGNYNYLAVIITTIVVLIRMIKMVIIIVTGVVPVRIIKL